MVQWLGAPLLLWGKIRQVQTCPFSEENRLQIDIDIGLGSIFIYNPVHFRYNLGLISIYYKQHGQTGVKAVYQYKIDYKTVIS